MKTTVLGLTLFLMTQLVFAGGFTVRNGGGLSEFNYEYAFLTAPSLMQKCLQQDFCHLTSVEKNATAKMLRLTPQKLQFADGVDFAKAKLDAELPGMLKWSKEGLVLVNLSQLYPEGQAFSSFEALHRLIQLYSVVIREPAMAESLATKILAGAAANSEILNMKSFGFNDNGFSFSHINDEVLFAFQDDLSAKNLTQQLQSQLECSPSSGPGTLTGLENLNWQEAQIRSKQEVLVNVSGRVYYRCGEGALLKSYVANIEVLVELTMIQGSSQDFIDGRSDARFETTGVHFSFNSISPN